MRYKKESSFWNENKNIDWFKKYPASSYWLEFLKKTKERSKKRALDLGCGAGRHTKLLAELGFDVYACDKHIGMVKQTKEIMSNMGWGEKEIKKRITRQSVENLSYDDDSFDVIICHGVYHNAFNLKMFKKAISESSRILRKNGKLLFNIFTNELLPKDLKKIGDDGHLYLTKENLRMLLVSPEEFLEFMTQNNMTPLKKELVRYSSEVSTGERAVFRGILCKK